MDQANKLLGNFISDVMDPALLVLFAAGLFLFMFGLFKFMRSAAQGDKLDTGKNHMIYGVIGMVIMVSVYGITNLIAGSLGINLSSSSQTIDTNVPSMQFVTP